MDLRNNDFSKIDDYSAYYNIYGNIDFYDENNLHITYETVLPFASAPACNRLQILNYIKLIAILFNQYEYTDIESNAQVYILTRIKKELVKMYDEYAKQLGDNKPSNAKNWAQRFDEDKDNSEIRSKLSSLDQINDPLEKLITSIENKLDNRVKR